MSTATSDSNDVLLRVDSLAKTWPDGGGLAPVSFDVASGRFVALRGRSGSGKSTVIAIIAGWCEADGGSVMWRGGSSVGSWSALAIVPQTFALVPELSIAENVELPLRADRTIERGERRARVAEVLEQFDVAALASRRPAETSMGQQQRVALARAFVGRPRLVLIDEPTSHQDHDHSVALVAALVRSAGAGTALVVATHDPSVLDAADRIVDLDPAVQ